MQERFETFTVLINRISRDIRRIKNQEMAVYHLRSAHVSQICLWHFMWSKAKSCRSCSGEALRYSRIPLFCSMNNTKTAPSPPRRGMQSKSMGCAELFC